MGSSHLNVYWDYGSKIRRSRINWDFLRRVALQSPSRPLSQMWMGTVLGSWYTLWPTLGETQYKKTMNSLCRNCCKCYFILKFRASNISLSRHRLWSIWSSCCLLGTKLYARLKILTWQNLLPRTLCLTSCYNF